MVDNAEGEIPEIPDFSRFSEIRKLDFPEEAVVSRELRDNIAKLQEAGGNPLFQLFGLIVGLGVMTTRATFGLEKQIIELRHEVRRSRGDS